jgi:PadR family transcriptional regulator PadR
VPEVSIRFDLSEVVMAGSDMFTGTLDVLILKALSWGPRHGYAVGRWIRETTRETLVVQEGALYPALHRLERRSLVSEEWGVSDTGREAKFYTLTPKGRAHLRSEIERWTTHSRAVSLALAVT